MELTFTPIELVSLRGGGTGIAQRKGILANVVDTVVRCALEKDTKVICDITSADIKWITTEMSKLLVGCTFQLEKKDMSPFLTIAWDCLLEGEPNPVEDEVSFTRLELRSMVASIEKPATCIKVIIMSFIVGAVKTAIRGENTYTDTVPAAELGTILVQLMHRFSQCKIEYTQKEATETYQVYIIW